MRKHLCYALLNGAKKSFGFCLIVAAFAQVASAAPPAVPEIDPNSAVAAIAMLVSGAAMLTGRRRK